MVEIAGLHARAPDLEGKTYRIAQPSLQGYKVIEAERNHLPFAQREPLLGL